MYNKKLMFALVVVVSFLFAFSVASTTVAAEKGKYPNKPIKWIVPWSAGGGTDTFVRLWSPLIEKELGQTLVIINKPGGAGSVAYTQVHRAKADGYTIIIASSTINSHKILGNLDFNYKDFEMVAALYQDPGGLVVRADAPWKTLEEFLDYARERPGKVPFITMSPGSMTRLGALAIELATNTKFNFITEPNGIGPALVKLVGGHVKASTSSPFDAMPLIQDGKVRMLATICDERVKAIPDVPTFIELGYKDVLINNVYIIMAPKGTSGEIIKTLSDAFLKVAGSEKYKNDLRSKAAIPLALGPKETKSLLDKRDIVFKNVIEKLGL